MLFVTTENEISWIIYSLFRGKQTIYLTLFSTKFVVKCDLPCSILSKHFGLPVLMENQNEAK